MGKVKVSSLIFNYSNALCCDDLCRTEGGGKAAKINCCNC